MDKLFTAEFWQTQWALVWRDPWAIIPLLVIAGCVGWIIKRWLDGREIRGLKAENKGLRAENDAAESRLKLAEDKQKAFTAPVQILSSPKLEEDVAVLKTEMAQIKGVLPQSLLTQLDKVAATTAIVTSTARVLSTANAVLGSTLSRTSASPALRSDPPSATTGSEDKHPSPIFPPKSDDD